MFRISDAAIGGEAASVASVSTSQIAALRTAASRTRIRGTATSDQLAPRKNSEIPKSSPSQDRERDRRPWANLDESWIPRYSSPSPRLTR